MVTNIRRLGKTCLIFNLFGDYLRSVALMMSASSGSRLALRGTPTAAAAAALSVCPLSKIASGRIVTMFFSMKSNAPSRASSSRTLMLHPGPTACRSRFRYSREFTFRLLSGEQTHICCTYRLYAANRTLFWT